MNAILSTRAPPPWYRQLWPWLLISIPLVSVLLGILMITLAVIGQDALVVDDWYKEGKAINRRIERDHEATRLGLVAGLSRPFDGLVLELAASDAAFAPPPSLDVRWVHVTRADRDGGASFAHAGGGRYVAAGAVLPEGGRWRIHVEPSAPALDTWSDPTDATAHVQSGDGSSAGTVDRARHWRLVSDVVTLAPDSEPRLTAAGPDASGGAVSVGASSR